MSENEVNGKSQQDLNILMLPPLAPEKFLTSLADMQSTNDEDYKKKCTDFLIMRDKQLVNQTLMQVANDMMIIKKKIEAKEFKPYPDITALRDPNEVAGESVGELMGVINRLMITQ